MDILNHFVHSQTLESVVFLLILVVHLSFFELGTVNLAIEIECFENFLETRRAMIYAIEEHPVAPLKQSCFSAAIVVLDHFIPKGGQWLLDRPLLSLGTSRVDLAFIVAAGPLFVNLQPQDLLRKFWTLKDVAEIRWTHCSSLLISLLQLLASEVVLLHVHFKVVFVLELLFAEAALLIAFRSCLLAAIVVQVVFDHAEIVEQALVSIFDHFDVVSFEQRLDLRLYPVHDVLRVSIRAEVILEGLLETLASH